MLNQPERAEEPAPAIKIGTCAAQVVEYSALGMLSGWLGGELRRPAEARGMPASRPSTRAAGSARAAA